MNTRRHRTGKKRSHLHLSVFVAARFLKRVVNPVGSKTDVAAAGVAPRLWRSNQRSIFEMHQIFSQTYNLIQHICLNL